MSLDDKLNPNDGSFIDRLDSALFRFNRNIAKKWQNKTYRNKEDLEKVLHGGSFIMLTTDTVIGKNYFMAFPAILQGIKCFYKPLRPRSKIEEETILEGVGFGKKFTKFLKSINLLLYAGGVVDTVIGTGYIITGALTGNKENYMVSIPYFAFGLGVLSWVSADYISRSDIGDPPPKPKKKPFLERIKEKIRRLYPQPLPHNIPLSYIIKNNYIQPIN